MRLDEKYFDLVDEAGFDSVRIPVQWSAHAETDVPYKIGKAFFASVDEAIVRALSPNIVVVINMHHHKEIFVSPEKHNERFLDLWKQVAEHYHKYPATLFFEILNEPSKQHTSYLWNEYLEEVITLIGKYNPYSSLDLPSQHTSIKQICQVLVVDLRFFRGIEPM